MKIEVINTSQKVIGKVHILLVNHQENIQLTKNLLKQVTKTIVSARSPFINSAIVHKTDI